MEKCPYCARKSKPPRISPRIKAGVPWGYLTIPTAVSSLAFSKLPADAIVCRRLIYPESQLLSSVIVSQNYHLLEYLNIQLGQVTYRGFETDLTSGGAEKLGTSQRHIHDRRERLGRRLGWSPEGGKCFNAAERQARSTVPFEDECQGHRWC